MKQSKKQKLKKKLDKLAQEIFVALNPECLICSNKTSAGHHYIQKSQSLYLRWDFRNYIPLCMPCHARHHKSGDPVIHQTILKHKGHEWADELQRDRRIFFKDTIGNLEEKLEEMQEYAREAIR